MSHRSIFSFLDHNSGYLFLVIMPQYPSACFAKLELSKVSDTLIGTDGLRGCRAWKPPLGDRLPQKILKMHSKSIIRGAKVDFLDRIAL